MFDALAHGKTVISNTAGGLGDFVSRDNSLIYGGTPSLFFDMPHGDPGLFTGIEQCFEPSPAELALTMRHFHLLRKGAQAGQLNEANQKEWETVLQRRTNAATIGEKMDYRVVSSSIIEQLLTVYKSWKEHGVARYEEPVKQESLEQTL